MESKKAEDAFVSGAKWLAERHFEFDGGGRYYKSYLCSYESVMFVVFYFHKQDHCIKEARGKWSCSILFQPKNKMGDSTLGNKSTVTTSETHNISFCDSPFEALHEAMIKNRQIFSEIEKITEEL